LHRYNFFKEVKSLGLNTRVTEAGYFSISFLGRVGRSTKLPEQLGHMFLKSSSAHFLQYVHSKEQIIASGEPLGKSVLQCSQLGLISNILWIFLCCYLSKVVHLWTAIIIQY